MTWVAGVDGCRGGWCVVLFCPTKEPIVIRLDAFVDILELEQSPEIIAVDIPIGLLDQAQHGGRECDREARKKLLHPRKSSVFSPPVRSALGFVDDYEAAREANKRSSRENISLSSQTCSILGKMLEVDRALLNSPDLRKRVREIHPELSFYEMNRSMAMKNPKKRSAGILERLNLLQRINEFMDIANYLKLPPAGVKKDDVIDAFGACWTALRIKRGDAIPLPENIQIDSKGLGMQIWR